MSFAMKGSGDLDIIIFGDAIIHPYHTFLNKIKNFQSIIRWFWQDFSIVILFDFANLSIGNGCADAWTYLFF